VERRLDGFRGDLLGQVEVAEPGGEEGQEAGPVHPEHHLDRRGAHTASSLTLVGRVRGAAVLDSELASSLT
jgi:hypothetical protein